MVEGFKKPKRKIPNRARNLLVTAGWVLAGLVFVSPASAQYSFSPGNADELGSGIKVFGSAKDDQGALLPGVSVRLPNAAIFVTDETGRYRGSLDNVYTAEQLAVTCSKPGYQFERVMKRAGPAAAAKQTIEADCVLHKS